MNVKVFRATWDNSLHSSKDAKLVEVVTRTKAKLVVIPRGVYDYLQYVKYRHCIWGTGTRNMMYIHEGFIVAMVMYFLQNWFIFPYVLASCVVFSFLTIEMCECGDAQEKPFIIRCAVLDWRCISQCFTATSHCSTFTVKRFDL